MHCPGFSAQRSHLHRFPVLCWQVGKHCQYTITYFLFQTSSTNAQIILIPFPFSICCCCIMILFTFACKVASMVVLSFVLVETFFPSDLNLCKGEGPPVVMAAGLTGNGSSLESEAVVALIFYWRLWVYPAAGFFCQKCFPCFCRDEPKEGHWAKRQAWPFQPSWVYGASPEITPGRSISQPHCFRMAHWKIQSHDLFFEYDISSRNASKVSLFYSRQIFIICQRCQPDNLHGDGTAAL